MYVEYIHNYRVKLNIPSTKCVIIILIIIHVGAPLIIHPGRSKAAPFEIVDILREAGADISRTVMSHLDRTFSTPDEFLKFAETGCYSELDVFGIECSQYQVSNG